MKRRYIVAILLCVITISSSALADRINLLAKAQAASVMIQNVHNNSAAGTAFVVQANDQLVAVSVEHVYADANSDNAAWVLMRSDWQGTAVQVAAMPKPEQFQDCDLRAYFSNNMPLPRQCRISPLRQFNTPMKGETLYMVGNFYEGGFDRLLSGRYVGAWNGFGYTTKIAGNGPGTSGSPVLNRRGHVVGIMSGRDPFTNGSEYDRFEPIEHYEAYNDWFHAEARRRGVR